MAFTSSRVHPLSPRWLQRARPNAAVVVGPRHLTPVVCRGHTMFMKVAVSIPDPIFREAERISRRIRVPRSQFYARALEAYVRERSGEDVTAQLNEVYARSSAKLDPAAEALSLEILRREKW